MLQDIPYSKIKDNGRKYEVYILRSINRNTYTDIARKYEVSINTITSDYHKILFLIRRYYINHLSIVHGYETRNYFRQLWCDVEDCYKGRHYAIAYFEKEYYDILREYRAGEPGMPDEFLRTLPPYRKNFSKQTVASIIKLREIEGLKFPAIGKRLRMTREKAIELYENYYHKKFLQLSDLIMSVTGEEDLCSKYYAKYNVSKGKLRYDNLVKDYPDFVDIKK